MEVLIVALAMAAAFTAAFFFASRDRAKEREAANKREGQLLDRLMARDFSEYKLGELAQHAGDGRTPIMTDEREAALEQVGNA